MGRLLLAALGKRNDLNSPIGPEHVPFSHWWKCKPPFSQPSALQKSSCQLGISPLDGLYILPCGHGLLPPRRFPYLRFWRIRACGTNRGIHMLSHDLYWTRRIQGLADRSHEGDGLYRLYGTDQFTCHPAVTAALAITPAGRSP
jgi:hypothetical protein